MSLNVLIERHSRVYKSNNELFPTAVPPIVCSLGPEPTKPMRHTVLSLAERIDLP